MLGVPMPVSRMIDDTCDTPYNLSVTVSEIANGFAHIESRIVFRRENRQFINKQRRTKIGTVFIKIISKLNKLFEFLFALYFTYFYCHKHTILNSGDKITLFSLNRQAHVFDDTGLYELKAG